MDRAAATRREAAVAAAKAATGNHSQNTTQEKLLPPGVLQAESSLGYQDAMATEAELGALARTELSAAQNPERVLVALAAVDYGMDGSLLVNSLLDALTEAASSQPSTTFDPIFKAKPTLSSTKVIAPPSMRRTDGKYRANQLEILTAANPATFHDMILRRRGMCWRALSKQYLASRVFFMKLWIFMLVEVLELDPRRRWTGAVSPTEDSIMEEFVLFCSNRFVTWGSVMAAKTHVVEFMRSMFGAVPPPFPCTRPQQVQRFTCAMAEACKWS